MSDYRDDTQETAVASSAVWIGLSSLTEGLARASSALMFGLLVLHADGAVASDAVLDHAGYMVVEHASASDRVIDARASTHLISEQARAADRVLERLRVLHADSAQAADLVLDRVAAVVSEHAAITDEVIAHRHAGSQIIELARAHDAAPSFGRALTIDVAEAGDWSGGRLHAAVLAVDSAALADEAMDARGSGSQAPAADQAHIASEVLDHLHAAVLVSDAALAADQVIQQGAATGQAWTANADTWAMSRWAPLQFTGLVVIDGQLFGLSDAGVHAVDTPQPQAAVLATAPVDVGKGMLVHPLQAFLEYQLEDGAASMDVTTTQSGQAATYSYPLEAEPAAALTNGRFRFGRGLRGRHFSFTLRLNAKRGHINDLSVNAAPTKRRV